MTTTDQLLAESLAGEHYNCEDCWYSCPLSVDGCCNDAESKECNCGYEERVTAIVLAFATVRQAAQQEERERWNEIFELLTTEKVNGYQVNLLLAGAAQCLKENGGHQNLYAVNVLIAAREKALTPGGSKEASDADV